MSQLWALSRRRWLVIGLAALILSGVAVGLLTSGADAAVRKPHAEVLGQATHATGQTDPATSQAPATWWERHHTPNRPGIHPAAVGIISGSLPFPPPARVTQPGARRLRLNGHTDHSISAPTRLRAGRYTFTAASPVPLQLQLAHPVTGYTRAEFVRDVTARLTPRLERKINRMARWAGGASAFGDYRGEFTTTLQPGTYWAFSMSVDDLKVWRIAVITVRGPAVTSRFPRVSGIVRARSRGWTSSSSVRAGYPVLVANSSTQPQSLEVMRLRKGKTLADYRRWIQLLAGEPSVDTLNEFLDVPFEPFWFPTALLAPDTSFVLRLDVPPGRYVMVPQDMFAGADARLLRVR